MQGHNTSHTTQLFSVFALLCLSPHSILLYALGDTALQADIPFCSAHRSH